MEEDKEIKEENEEIVNENNRQDLILYKKNNVLVIGLVILIILLAGGLVYMLFFYNDKEEPKENNSNNTPTVTPVPTEKEESTPTPVPQEETDADKKYELTVYKSTDTGLVTASKADYEWIVPAFKIKVLTKNAKVLAVDNENSLFVLYNDEGLYLYDVKAKNSKKINLENNYKEYILLFNMNNDNVIGIAYLKSDNTSGYYNVLEEKKLYDGKYKPAEYYNFYNVNDDYLTFASDEMSYLLSTKEEKVIKSYKNDKEDYWKHSYDSYKINDKYIYILKQSFDDGWFIKKIYNDQMKEFYSGNISGDTEFSIYNNSIYLADSDTVYKYDANGNILKSEKYENIELIIRNYVVYNTNSMIILENVEDSSEKKEIAKLCKDCLIDTYDSRYYTRTDLDSMDEKNKKEGLYIVIDYPSKNSNGNYGMEYCYTPDKEIIEYAIKQEKGGRAKPVLYLYPEKETNVEVKFEHPELLTTTYPKYINSWKVKVSPNGDMKDTNGKYYYALYWDEKRYNEVDFSEGFYVESKDAIKFLEEKLTFIGLNDKERNEFIMYWLPIMEANKKNLVYFELTKERESGNKLIITPKPDSLLRVSIHIKKVNEKVNIKEQRLTTFNRVGFTAVEWGGMTY